MLCLKRIGVPPGAGLPSMMLWPLKQLGCLSTCAEGVQGSQGYHGIGVPQETKEMWESLFLKGLGCPPCTGGSLAPCPPPEGTGRPPLYRNHVETPGPTRSHLGIAVSLQRRSGVSLPMPGAIWEWGVWGSPCLSSMGLEVPQGWGYIGSPIPITLWNWGPHDPHVDVPDGGGMGGCRHHPTLFLQGIGVPPDPRVGMVPITP